MSHSQVKENKGVAEENNGGNHGDETELKDVTEKKTEFQNETEQRPTSTLNDDGHKDEDSEDEIIKQQMKKDRSNAKRAVTKKRNEIMDMMCSYQNLSSVIIRLQELDDLQNKFIYMHEKYHHVLTDITECTTSGNYRGEIERDICELRHKVNLWVSQAQDRLQEDDIQPEDSASQVQFHRHHKTGSKLSSSSSALSAKARATARVAVLEAEANALHERQELDKEQMKLQFKREQLEIKTELAKANAEEKAYSAIGAKSGIDSHVHKQSQKCVNTKSENGEKPQDKINTSLSPEAPEWHMPQSEKCTSETLLKLIHNEQQQNKHTLDVFQLPKVELTPFDGDPLNYWTFIRSFESSIDKHTVDDNSKLTRLIHYCTGKAKKVIQCCAVMDTSEGYIRAKQLLQERFGDEYKIAEAWIEKISGGPQIKGAGSLQDYADELHNCKEILCAMNKLNEINNQKSLLRIIEKLPIYIQNRWKRKVWHIRNESRSPTIHDIEKFVRTAAQEENDPVYGNVASHPKPQDKHKPQVKSVTNKSSTFSVQSEQVSSGAGTTSPSSASQAKRECLLCKQSHPLVLCYSFRKMHPDERFKLVHDNNLCHNCLIPGHNASVCRNDHRCKVDGCGKKHSTFLHTRSRVVQGSSSSDDNSASQSTSVKKSDSYGQSHSASSAQNGFADVDMSNYSVTGAGVKTVALPIVKVRVRAISGNNFVETYALLDSGSTNTFCSDTLLCELGVKGRKEVLFLTTLEKKSSAVETSVVRLEISDLHGNSYMELPHVYSKTVLPIHNKSIANQQDVAKWPHLKGVQLPTTSEQDVQLLIGQDNPWALIPLEIKRGSITEPYATRTMLGWSVNGPLGDAHKHMATVNFVHLDQSLHTQVERFWKMDDYISDDKVHMSVNDKKVIHQWNESVTLKNGHYELCIPFKKNSPDLPNNKSMAEHRLQSLQGRFRRNKELFNKYNGAMRDLLDKNYAMKVPEDELQRQDGRLWYLPHHPVFHPQKPDKTRIVFDCAARYQGVSLNEEVLQGPNLTNELFGVLLRFRQEQVALIADIEGMFHQVRVVPKDCDVLRFLWWSNGNISEQPSEYRMLVHLFGGTWSPSCASFALQKTADDHKSEYPDAITATVKKNFYVDDCLKTVKTEEEAKEVVPKLTSLLAQGGFHLTKWMCNKRGVLETIPKPERAKQVSNLDLEKASLPTERALGVYWDSEDDMFVYKTITKNKPHTRRGILSVVCSIYDPFGFVGPYILQAKRILQELCRLKLDWDEPIPENEYQAWKCWLEDLHKIEQVKVPRCVKPVECIEVASVQLHHFSDASTVGFGCVSYLRITDESGLIHCSIMVAKSRLAPMKSVTIPRLELQAATLSVKMDRKLRQELEIEIEDSYFWTDSTTVLKYINNEDRRYKTFVANRVTEIREGSKPSQWCYINTKLNPADYASRGLSGDELVSRTEWLKGPRFLWQGEDFWPKDYVDIGKVSDDDLDVKPNVQVFAAEEGQDDVIQGYIEKHSSWYELKRNVAWLLRVKKLLKDRKDGVDADATRSTTLTVKELQASERAIIKHVQASCFREELTHVKKTSPLYRLDPIKSEDGVLVVGGRLRHSTLMEDAKHQVILPKNHHIVNLLIRHYHEISGHSGREHVLSLIRERFWIIKSRVSINKVLRDCFKCKRTKATPVSQKMADLPIERVTPEGPPFTYVGIDYFGPFTVKRGRSMVKRYGCVFTCLTIRAVHIEIAHALDTDSFICALHRFISRRGEPEVIFSDNGTNFVGAVKELKVCIQEWNQRKIDQFLKQKDIVWKFNPPYASHMGGIWERQIRTIRKILNSLLKEQPLSDEGLSTLMCQVEAIINSRPLTMVSDDPRDPNPLTPNHLLLMRSGSKLPPGIFTKEDTYSKKMWRQVQYLCDVFWRRWLKEYLPSLQERQKWLLPRRNISVGDIVLVVTENTPRSMWPLGRIVSVYPGKDGYVRSAQVKTQASTLNRPVDKLCLLEAVERRNQ